MLVRHTYVCEDCHAGWQVDLHVMRILPGPGSICRWCGKNGKLRGMYGVMDLPPREEET